MEKMKFRNLRPDEIDCRAAQVVKGQNGVRACILLYKDARVDQNILDETFGPFGWQRSHTLIGDRLYCTVSVRGEDGTWVSKQDVGTESYTEKEKGQASDSFKRACFNWGIGRELYTAPRIWITLNEKEYYTSAAGKTAMSAFCSFTVKEISYDKNGSICGLIIADNNGNERFRFGSGKPQPQPRQKAEPGKPPISDKQFEQAMKRLNAGERSLLDKIEHAYALNEEQQQILKQYK